MTNISLNIDKRPIPVGVSPRHVHLSQEHLELLFGRGAKLTKIKDLTQGGQFACSELVRLTTLKGTIGDVRVLGPVRRDTQVEISKTDARVLGLDPPVRDSGDHENSPGVTVVGPQNALTIARGVIVAWRHIHMTPRDAFDFGFQDKEIVMALAHRGDRSIIFDKVLIRIHESYVRDFHVDTDEANAAGIVTGDHVFIINKNEDKNVLAYEVIEPDKGKKVLTERELMLRLKKGEKIRIAPGIIMTPSAKDLARKHGII